MTSSVQLVTIDESSHDQRLDNFLLKTLKKVPKSLIYKIIRKGEVRINKKRAKPESRLVEGDIVRIPPVHYAASEAGAVPSKGLLELLDQSVLYDSDELMIINKPSGLAVHGGSGVSLGLIEALRAQPNAPRFLELVHRLDKATSGCIMVAKKRAMLKYLQDLLRSDGGIDKRYLALVAGAWPKRKEFVNVPLLKREARNGERFVEVNIKQGKPSRTAFKIIEGFDAASLVEASPITGRTHQIRVHARHVGCALIGDDKYGDEATNTKFREFGIRRLFLHAYSLRVPLANGERLCVEAPLPQDLQRALQRMRG